MSHLLFVTRWGSEAVAKGGDPLCIEFPVNPETAPYLVTSLHGLRWVERHSVTETPKAEAVVRSMVRDTTPEEVFTQVVNEVKKAGIKQKWGNVLPLTPAGFVAAQEYLASYELTEVDVLAPLSPTDPARMFLKQMEKPYQPCAWMPGGTLAVVPKDRSFVGVVGMITQKKLAGVIHNAARSIALLTAPPTTGRKGRRTADGPSTGGPDRADRPGQGVEQGLVPGGVLPASGGQRVRRVPAEEAGGPSGVRSR